MFRSLAVLLPLVFHSAVSTNPNHTDAAVVLDSPSWITPNISALAQAIQDAGVPGQSVGVVRLNNSSVEVQYGAWGNYTEDGNPVVPDTRFAIASCSKAFTAAAIGILMDDFLNGRNVTALPNGLQTFNWETKVRDLFPGDTVWKLQDQWSTEKANVGDILGHVTGLTGHDYMYMSEDTPASIAPRFRYLRQNFELRQRYSYSSLMYMFAAHIIDTYSGKSFADFVKERIFEPLRMASTTFSVEEAMGSGNMSQAWASTNGRRIPFWLTEEIPTRLISGAGGIISSAVDMTKWAAMLLNGGVDPYTNKTVIPRWILDAITTARTIVAGNTTAPPQIPSRSIIGYGLGWARLSYQGHDLIMHDGGIPGFLTTVMVFPGDNLALVSFVNTDGPAGVSELLPAALIENILGLDNFQVVEGEAAASALAGPNSPPSAGSAPPPSNNCHGTGQRISTSRFAGTYANRGYGNFTFCAAADSAGVTSPYCNSTLADFASLGQLDNDTLYAKSHRIVSHFSMERTCGVVLDAGSDDSGLVDFVMHAQNIHPNGYGKNTTAFAEEGGALLGRRWHVKCAIDGQSSEVVGCGWMDVEDGQWNKPSTGSVQDLADVWWDRV